MKHYVIKSDRDNRVIVGPISEELVDGEHKRLSAEAARHAPESLNLPSEEDAANDENAAAIRSMLMESGPAPAETFTIEEVDYDPDHT